MFRMEQFGCMDFFSHTSQSFCADNPRHISETIVSVNRQKIFKCRTINRLVIIRDACVLAIFPMQTRASVKILFGYKNIFGSNTISGKHLLLCIVSMYI